MKPVSHRYRPGIAAAAAALSLAIAELAPGADPAPDDWVEVVKLDPTIKIDLPYATESNFCKVRLYPEERCFLRREVAEKVVAAHRSLAPLGVGLKIWDGYRPLSVQRRMWEISPSRGYVGDPNKLGSRHNRGAAVDVTLVNLITGAELEMPTPYDVFTPRAHANYIKLEANVAENRALLQRTMRDHGFSTIATEWWHFDYAEWRRFELADRSFADLSKLTGGVAGPDHLAEAAGPSKDKPAVPKPAMEALYPGRHAGPETKLQSPADARSHDVPIVSEPPKGKWTTGPLPEPPAKRRLFDRN